ncbi:hypothetical protein B0I37DRAFT_147839 [Chaetomium sp. MPI-CAGE-AT-0009]|nr:hypothetical protein B0I37DRAFT_147839 [Chaetomium sp. MPI-CAGE-AT-0009]
MAQHSWTYRWTDNGFHPPPVLGPSRLGRIAAVAEFQSRAYRKKLRATIRVWSRLFGSRIVEFEFAIHIRSKAWLSPTLELAVRSINIRPWGSEIFSACQTFDIARVKNLFESGKASINDVCENQHKSILDYAVGPSYYADVCRLWQSILYDRHESSPLHVVRYLLDIGCDPNIGKLSPLSTALYWGHIDSARLLLRAGADLYSDPDSPTSSYLCDASENKFTAGVELLIEQDYWAWTGGETANNTKTARQNFLTTASTVGSLQYVMMAIDILGFPQSRFPRAVTAAATNGRLEVVSMFRKLGCEMNLDVRTRNVHALALPILQAAKAGERTMIHYLLFQGATSFCHEEADYLWHCLWQGMSRRFLGDEWIFQEVEGVLWHVLLHVGVVEMTNPYPTRRSPFYWITHSNVAQLWSFTDRSLMDYGIEDNTWMVVWESPPTSVWTASSAGQMNACLDDPEKTLAPFIAWSATGVISKYVKAVDGNTKATSGPDEELPDVMSGPGLLVHKGAWWNQFAGAILTEREFSAEEMEFQRLPHYLRVIADGRDGIPFEKTSMFRQTIATEEGRRHMSRFPLVRALCNAFQFAGYRAEMDNDGDIWFEVDDGDPYYDAREHQPGPGEEDGAAANCPICQDPEKHGLGYILRRAKAGEDYVDEFRAKRKGKGNAGGF